MTDPITRKQLASAILVVALTSLGLSACGSSSGSSASTSSSTTVANVSHPTGGGTKAPGGDGTGAPAGGGLAGMRACLQQHGIALPRRKPGETRPLGGLVEGAGGGRQLPKGVTRAQLQAALAKCGGPANLRGRRFGGPNRFANPALRTALAKFATCMRRHGVAVPAPDTSGNGPVFSTQGLNTASAGFKAAQTKCQSILRSAFPRRPGSGGGGR